MKIVKISASLVLGLALVSAIWLAVGLWWPLAVPRPNQQFSQLLVADIAIVDVESGQLQQGQDILIEFGHITAVGPDLSAPGAVRMDGRGRFAIPGLFDMHVHSTKMAPVLTHPLFIAAGVTAVRDMGGCLGVPDGFVACLDEKRAWNREVGAAERVAPRYDQLTSLAINGGQEIPAGLDIALGAGSAAGARLRVALAAQRGVDFLKPYTMLPRAGYFELAKEAKAAGLYLAGHQPLIISALEAIAAGQRSIEHAFVFIWDCYPGMSALRQVGDPRKVYTRELREAMIADHDAELCSELHRRMAAAGTAFVPTHTTRKLDAFALDERFRNDMRLRYIPGPLRRMWLSDADNMARRAGEAGQQSYLDFYRFGIQQTGVAHQAGVTVLAGTDSPDSFAFPGTALHDELEHLSQAGLSPIEVLRSATLEPARFLGLDGRAGVIKAGARADIVLLGTDPLQDIRGVRDIEAVILAGAVYDRGDLDRMLDGVESAAGSWAMWPRFVRGILTSPIIRKQFGD